jgi:hypothetical protein
VRARAWVDPVLFLEEFGSRASSLLLRSKKGTKRVEELRGQATDVTFDKHEQDLVRVSGMSV